MNRDSPSLDGSRSLARPSNRFRTRSLQAAAAGLAATAVAETASATIIKNLSEEASLTNLSFTVDAVTPINGQVNLVSMNGMGGTTDLMLEAPVGAMMAILNSVELHVSTVGMNDFLVAMTVGQDVDASLSYGPDAMLVDDDVPFTGWVPGVPGYAGFFFDNGGTINYGWLQLTIDADFQDFTVHQWAYQDDPTMTLTVGQVPEPSTAIMLGLGLLGLSAFSRKRPRSSLIDGAS